MNSLVGHAIALIFGVSLASTGYQSISKLNQLELKELNREEQLYLPSGKGIKFISLGYNQALADLLWFDTIGYFGKHYATDRNYEWLFHMCDLVTTLDPRALHVYEFGALMLAWEAESPEKANRLLSKAIEQSELREHSELWRMFYLRGVNSSLFLKNPFDAASDFAAGAKLPHTDPIMARLASRKLLNLGHDREEALSFLEDAISMTKDPTVRQALEKRLRETLKGVGSGEN